MSSRSNIKVSIIIPVYNNWGDTIETLRDLAKQELAAFQVLIADDGSPEPAPAEIFQFEFARYYRGTNLGFGGNCNRAAAEAIDCGATHLLFLNNDTEFSKDFVGSWLGAIESLPDAILSPLIYWSRWPGRVWYSGGRQSILVPFCRLRKEYPVNTEVDVICGCAMLVPVRVWEALGGFNEVYETYFEDFDLCLRARQLGVPIYVVADEELKVRHKVSGSFRGPRIWKQQYLMLTTRLIFIRTHYRKLTQLLCLGLCLPHLLVMAIGALPRRPQLRLLWRAFVTGIRESNEAVGEVSQQG